MPNCDNFHYIQQRRLTISAKIFHIYPRTFPWYLTDIFEKEFNRCLRYLMLSSISLSDFVKFSPNGLFGVLKQGKLDTKSMKVIVRIDCQEKFSLNQLYTVPCKNEIAIVKRFIKEGKISCYFCGKKHPSLTFCINANKLLKKKKNKKITKFS